MQRKSDDSHVCIVLLKLITTQFLKDNPDKEIELSEESKYLENNPSVYHAELIETLDYYNCKISVR